MTLVNSATQLMVQYARYHRDRRNIATHLLGVPLIFFSIGVLLCQPVGVVAGHTLTWAWLAWGLTSLWYLRLGAALLGLATVAVNAGLIALAHQAPAWAAAQGWASRAGPAGLLPWLCLL